MSRARPAAFMSYAHSDDAGGRLTKFCKHLSQEVEAQDKKDIGGDAPVPFEVKPER